MACNISLEEIRKNICPPTLKREFHGDRSSNQQTLHILQWNILAQGLSNPEGNFVRVKKETVAFDNRKWRILEQILIHQPDLCALEEVDTYECFLQHHLPKHGYTCFFTPKLNSPCYVFQFDEENFKGPDGILLCYKTALFDEIKRYFYQQQDDIRSGQPFFSVFELKHKPTSKHIVFVGTHLKAKTEFSNIRKSQTEAILQYLNENYSKNTHIIIAGDFNGQNTEPFYDIIRNVGYLSAYQTILNSEETSFTTWKFREKDEIPNEQCRTIDYIFYKPEGFIPIAVLKLPVKDDIGCDGLPSNEYPSDHLAIETIFNIKP